MAEGEEPEGVAEFVDFPDLGQAIAVTQLESSIPQTG
jgi:hypothetical protein